MFGPRFLSVQERFEVTASGTSTTQFFFPPGAAPFNFTFDADGALVVDDDDVPITVPIDLTTGTDATAATRAETRNSLIGLQIGLEYNLPVSQDIYFQVSGRGGIFFNSAQTTRSVSPLREATDVNSELFTTAEVDRDSGESFLAEINARFYADLIPNSVSCYAGYDVLFVDQLALAPNQSVAVGGVDRDSDLFARGFTFGVKTNY